MIDVRLVATDGPVDFRRCDVGIWYGPDPPGQIIKPFLYELIQPLCSPRLLGADRPLKQPGDLSVHTMIHTERNVIGWHDWRLLMNLADLKIEHNLSLYPSHVAIEAAVKGFGVILESDILTGEEVSSGTLMAPFANMGVLRTSYYIIYPAEHVGREALTIFEAWMAQVTPVANHPGHNGQIAGAK